MSDRLDPEEEAAQADLSDTLVSLVKSGLLSGIFLAGRVLARSRRFVGDDNKEVVDYRLLCGDTVAVVSEWEPDGKYNPVGADIIIPVKISAYHTPGGGAAYRLQTGKLDRAVAF